MSLPPLRILIVDDTALYRKILTDALAQIPDTVVTGAVASGPLALNLMATQSVDLVLIDIFMPEMNGPEVLARIRRDHPTVCAVMISGATGADAAITLKCLADGALDFIPKPQVSSYEEGMARLRANLRDVLRLVRIRRMAQNALSPKTIPAAPSPTMPVVRKSPPPAKLDLLLIGVSTGGPLTLQQILGALPADFHLPIVIVQHMPPLFTKSLAEQLTKNSKLVVAEAIHDEKVVPGRVLLAPGGRHLEITRDSSGVLTTRLTDAPPVNACRPAVDVLFKSAATIAPRGVLSLILTGMGEDGAAGVAALKSAVPTWSIVQDEATCVIYGMPQAVVRRKLEDEILPLPSIAPRLIELAKTRS